MNKLSKIVVINYLVLVVIIIATSETMGQQNKAEVIQKKDSLLNLISKNPTNPQNGARYLEIANLNLDLLEYDQALTNANKSLDFATLAVDTMVILGDYLVLGDVYNIDYEAVKALEYYFAAKKILEKKPNPKTEAKINSQIGIVYFNRQHYGRAAESFEQALEEYRKLNDNKNILDNTKYLATCYAKLEKYDIAIKNYVFLLNQYQKNNSWTNTKMVYQNLNEIFKKQNDYDKILKYNKQLYQQCLKKKDTKESLNALNNIAYCYVLQKEYDQAIETYNQLLESDNNEKLNAGTYTSLGLCYQNIHNDKAAIDNLTKASLIRHKHNQNNEASIVDNILARVYLRYDDLHNAEYRANMAVTEAETSAKQGKDENGELRKTAYLTYNTLLTVKGDDKEALNYYKKYLALRDSLQIARENEDRRLSEDLKYLSDAEKRIQESLAEAEINELSKKQLELLAQNRQKENELLTKDNELLEKERQRAEQALEIARQERDAAEKRNEIENLLREQERAQNEIERKEIEEKERTSRINSLEQQQKNQELELENEKKDAELMRLFIILAGLVIVFFVYILITLRLKNHKLKHQRKEIARQNNDLILKNEEITIQKENLEEANNKIMNINNELSQQKAIVEEANKSITDSIVYAQRIQTAVCPPPTLLSTFNLEYFLLFRPRDIVSGDYYWLYSDNVDSIFIVAADCTGHGVPGAFMSMLGISLLNKVVSERNIFEPADILTELRKEIKEALHQESFSSAQKDGMDLSLVRYDISTKKITFAGANNNGYLVKRYANNEEETAKADAKKTEHLLQTDNGYLAITIMPADAMPIGIYLREKEHFTQKEYNVRQGDTIYLTSDGYLDQFGGSRGRKFLTKNFEKMLLDINNHSLEKQKDIVADTHDKWKGTEYPQLDDIIVMGIRF